MKRIAFLAASPALVIAGPAPAADTQTPQAWMERLYGQFRNHHDPDYHGEGADRIFTPDLAMLERRHEAQTDAGQDDHDDGNDLCLCQDTGHPTWKISTTQQGSDKATSNVLFTDRGQTIGYRFSLRLTGAGWRISDFQVLRNTADKKPPAGGYPSFRAGLIASIRYATTQKEGSH